MLNYQSVRSSEPQIRSNPALRPVNEKSGFQKRLSTLLEPTPLPFPTFQLVKEASCSVLEKQQLYAWVRPSHLRSQWLVLADGFPTMLLDPKHTSRLSSIRIPFDKQRVQLAGPVVCEAAWDAQDHILWIWDVVVWEKQVIWDRMPYSERWELVKTVFGTILDCGHPMSDAEVRVPTWLSLAELEQLPGLDPAYSVEFQPEKAGSRRHLYLVQNDSVKFKATRYHERKMVAEEVPLTNPKKQNVFSITSITSNSSYGFVEDNFPDLPVVNVKPVEQSVAPVETTLDSSITTDQPIVKHTVARIRKDPTSRIPDTYRLESLQGEALGLAAIRSLAMSKQLREAFQVATDSLVVDVQWYEPFHKYEVKQVK